jgi:tetratricopeptide (TPR) repeat protein
MEDRSDQQIDHYHLLRLLGRGTFGEVYLGENIHRKTHVAIKVFCMQLNKEDVIDFLNEARIFRLRHPHIISVLDFGIDRSTETFFIVMDYAHNGTLRQRHAPGTPVPLAMVVAYVKQLAAALQHAHNENLIHRDVKPENMLVGANNDILLSDFGVAIVPQSMRTSVGKGQGMAGTPAYMAPEQWQGKSSCASDQYALGVIVYEWLSGQSLFNGTTHELMDQHMQVPPPPLPTSLPLYSPELEQVIMKALEKDPKKRFATVQEFAVALEEAYKKMLAGNLPPAISPKTKEQWLDMGMAHVKAKRYAEAIAAYSHAIELDPNHARAYYDRGLTYYILQQYQQALADYSRVIELNPNNVRAYHNRGDTYQTLRQYQQALADYSRAIELDPNYASVYNNRGVIYETLQQYQQALADYSRAIELDPNNARAYKNRGLTYKILQQYHQALADYSSAIELNPKSARAYYNRGVIYEILQQYHQALADYSRAIELYPNYVRAYKNRGLVYRILQEYQQALADYSRAIELDPNYASAYKNRGITYNNLHQYQEALTDYSRAIELDPNYARAYHCRGYTYYTLHQYQEALTDYSRAIELNPNSAGAYIYRGKVYEKLEQYKQALDNYDRALALNPNNNEVHESKERVQQKLHVITQVPGSEAGEKEEPSKTAVSAESIQWPHLRII